MNQYQNQLQAGTTEPQRPEGRLTQHVRSLAGVAEDHEYRLRSLLRALRVPPPEKGESGAVALVRSIMEEELARHENAQSAIGELIGELESLLA